MKRRRRSAYQQGQDIGEVFWFFVLVVMGMGACWWLVDLVV